MERGTCSRHSWADEVEEDEAAQSTGRSVFLELPALAMAAQAELVLRSSSLDPEAEPFPASLERSTERLHFSDSEASLGESDTPLL
jgi:hypothetical protein